MIKEFLSSVKYFFRGILNFWEFRQIIYYHRDWDYSYSIKLFSFGLTRLGNFLEKSGTEVEESRMAKVYKIKRAVEILEAFEKDNWLFLAEERSGKIWQDGDKEQNLEIINLALKMEEEWTEELFTILKGNPPEDKEFDGSGIKGWWD